MEKGFDLAVQAPMEFSQVKIRMQPSEKLEVVGPDQFNIVDLKQSEEITLRAKQPGRHTLVLNLEAVKDAKPVSMIRRIYVNVKAPEKSVESRGDAVE